MLDAAYGLQQVEQAGIPVARTWHNYIPVAFSEYWLDPQGSEIKPDAAANFKYDPTTAKQLVDATGGPFETEFHYSAQNSGYGEPYRIISELLIQYLSKVGITAKAFEEDYNSTFLLQSGQGKTNGLTWIPQTRTDPFAYYQTQYLNPTHPIYGRWVDQPLTTSVQQIQALTDPAQLKARIKDLQNELGGAHLQLETRRPDTVPGCRARQVHALVGHGRVIRSHTVQQADVRPAPCRSRSLRRPHRGRAVPAAARAPVYARPRAGAPRRDAEGRRICPAPHN